MQVNPALRPNNPLNNVKQMIQFVRTAQNPQLALQTVMNNNPQIAQAASLARSMNMDFKSAFYQLAAQQGVNGDEFLNELMR